MGKHVPQTLLKCLGIAMFQHLVLANNVMRRNGLIKAGILKLLAGDAGENHTMPPGKSQFPRMGAGFLNQL